MATLEQRRAAFALEQVEEVLKNDKKAKLKAKYKTQLLKLPARLHSNGLGQTVAFYLSAGSDKPEADICGWLETWLNGGGKVYEGGRLIDNVIGKEIPDAESRYREASMEARALAVWLKRFAEAFIEGAPEEE